uniref:Uncharacterized protein n=1 Tax=Timema poppense TaxID=170557 RepID=A0A7R9HEC9_TIMPO|nr:unnamed protein product [Timema poppensis]
MLDSHEDQLNSKGYKNSFGYISEEDSPPTVREECYKPPSGENISPLSCTIALLTYAEAGSIVSNNKAETCQYIAQENHVIPETDHTESKTKASSSAVEQRGGAIVVATS